MLDKKFIEEIKKRLLQEKERIIKEIKNLEKHTMEKSLTESSGNLSSYMIHFADLGSDTLERDTELDLLTTESELLKKVERALKKIEKGEYGKCESCGKFIPRKRLEAIPYTTLCKECQEKEETQ